MNISIKEIKSRLSIETVLNHYGLLNNIRQKGSSFVGPCPIHGGDNLNAFHVNVEQNIWNCFTRNHGGNVFDMIRELEKCSFKEALKIAKSILTCPGTQFLPRTIPKKPQKKIVNNQPLKFKLNLDGKHPYLKERGLSKKTIDYFGLGCCNHGIMKGRIAIPIHDESGRCIAYVGRRITGESEKYKIPYGFNKSFELYNYFRVKKQDSKDVIVVEGFFDCLNLYQNGFQNAVALMGWSMSRYQKALLIKLDKRIIIYLDGDKAGRIGTEKIIKSIKGELPYKAVYLPDGFQPDQLNKNELNKYIGNWR